MPKIIEMANVSWKNNSGNFLWTTVHWKVILFFNSALANAKTKNI